MSLLSQIIKDWFPFSVSFLTFSLVASDGKNAIS